MLQAIKLGDVAYHAGPMNMQPENMNALLFELSLNISLNIDNFMGIQRQYRTLSQRDVPGNDGLVVSSLDYTSSYFKFKSTTIREKSIFFLTW